MFGSGENLTFGAGKQAEDTEKNIEKKARPGFETFGAIVCFPSISLWCRK